MNIEIKYCNSIDEAKIEIKEKELNIKYGINGTGKSTIAKAITLSVEDKNKNTSTLKNLKQFKHKKLSTHNPSVVGTEFLNSTMVFDEAYVNKFLFQKDELVKGSFDIFIRDEKYVDGVQEIENLVKVLKETLTNDTEIEILIKDFEELSSSFGNKKDGIHASSSMAKAFRHGNQVDHIPAGLEDYSAFIQNKENNYKWVKWQIDGKNYLDLSDNCPYCVTNVSHKKDSIKKVSETYKDIDVESLNKLVAIIQRLDKYFSDDTKEKIKEFVSNINGYTEPQASYLRQIKEQIDLLKAQLIFSRQIGFTSFKDVDKTIDLLKDKKIDLKLYPHLNSDSTKEKINIVNAAIDNLLIKAGVLQGSIAKQKKYIEQLIEDYNGQINSFLINAGFKYQVRLNENASGEHKLKLIHNDNSEELENATTHLSYGERNVFSLVLFAYDALKKSPDLIILDDPISSFDKNKKYAIIDFLFRSEKIFRLKTVLMLTHDLEPIIDMSVHHRDRFNIPFSTFIENNKGVVTEKIITKNDIKTFIEIVEKNSKEGSSVISSLIYLRRKYEVYNDKGPTYNLISSLLHKRPTPALWSEEKMSQEEINTASDEISSYIANFNYDNVLNILVDDESIKKLYFATTNNYEKLHLYRVYCEGKELPESNKIVLKFINESFHIENDYIYQLNPKEYAIVPQFVIDECDKIFS